MFLVCVDYVFSISSENTEQKRKVYFRVYFRGYPQFCFCECWTFQKAPLIATRFDMQKAAVRLGVDGGQEELEELWAFVRVDAFRRSVKHEGG